MADLVRFRNFVNGQPRESATGRWLASTNPYTGAEWAEVPHCGVDDVNDAIEAAHRAFTKGPWATLNATARGKLLRRLGDLIARDAEKLAAIEVRDNGKLLAEMCRAAALYPGMVLLFRRSGGQDRGRRPADRQAGHVHLHQARAAGRRRGDHAVELAAAAC